MTGCCAGAGPIHLQVQFIQPEVVERRVGHQQVLRLIRQERELADWKVPKRRLLDLRRFSRESLSKVLCSEERRERLGWRKGQCLG